MKLWPDDVVLRGINKLLVIIIAACCGYILIVPLIPEVDYLVRSVTKPVQVSIAQPDSIKRIDRTRNHLIIPALQIDEPVLDGPDTNTLDKGLWRRPATSTPDKGSNTVIAGHRFTYTDKPAFYSLDKLKDKDDLFLVYGGKIYHYISDGGKVVPPTAIEVEDPTPKSQLTLYTCTPLWTDISRLVYVGSLKEIL